MGKVQGSEVQGSKVLRVPLSMPPELRSPLTRPPDEKGGAP